MDVEKLIEDLRIACAGNQHNIMGVAATALSTLQAENERLWAELEQVLAERDAAVSWAQKYTESIDRPCVACKHNTGDYVCTAKMKMACLFGRHQELYQKRNTRPQ